MNSGPTVFLSHSSKDKAFVRALDRALLAHGVRPFLDERDIGVGESIPHRIHSEIESADFVCYIISENSVKSAWVQDELSKVSMLAKERAGIFILPIRIDDTSVPMAVRDLRHIDFSDADQDHLESSDAFEVLLNSLGERPSDLEPWQVAEVEHLDREFDRLMRTDIRCALPPAQVIDTINRIITCAQNVLNRSESWRVGQYATDLIERAECLRRNVEQRIAANSDSKAKAN